jgi:ABC-type Fe3+-hydroxamate transport system substrate-binding protein
MRRKHLNPTFAAFSLIALIAILTLPGCDDPSSPAPQNPAKPQQNPLRIVSLAPALTQVIIDLQQQASLVGVAHHDTAAPPGLPVVGDYIHVNTEAIISLRPTHVLMMVGHSGTPDYLKNLAEQNNFSLITYPSPLSIDAVKKIIFNPACFTGGSGVEAPCLGVVLGVPRQAQNLTRNLDARLSALRTAVAVEPPVSTLMVIGINPVVASGPGTVHDQLLHIAGGANAAASATVGAPVYDQENLIRLDPQTILLFLPNDPPLAPIHQDPRLADFKNLPIRAVTQQRIILLNDPAALLPSSSLVRIAAQIAQALHPALTDSIHRASTVDTQSDNPSINPNTQQPGPPS